MGWVEILISAGVAAAASIATAYVTANMTARRQVRRWRAEMAEKYASAVADDPARAQALAQQFAVGVLVVARTDNPRERDKVFLAANTRMTVGRGDACDLSLPDLAFSRRHFAISADDRRAYVEDLGSTSGTYLNGELVRSRMALGSGDVLRVGTTAIEFQALTPNL